VEDRQMKYMMFVAADPAPDAAPEQPGDIERWFDDVQGKWIIGERLRPARDAHTVRVRNGQISVTLGSSTAATEAIVGFDILDCENLDEAIAIAAKHPMARAGRLELRAFWPFEDAAG
jgi:hypothetical protein